MATRVVIHNPAFLEDNELVDSFVARQADLDWVIKGIDAVSREAGRHLLVYGPRGTGKTMLVRRVAAELRQDPELCQKWYPLALPEEINHVGTPGEFWLEAVAQLAQEIGESGLSQILERLMDEQDESALSRRALTELVEFGLSAGKRILLIVENCNRLIEKQIKVEGARALLDTLAIQPGIVLLATATALPCEIGTPDGTLRGYFQTRKLEPLTDRECAKIWEAFTGIEPDGGRIKALKILTGGNARLLAIISRFGAEKSLKGLMDELEQLVDEHTGYFKNILDSLSLTEGKVYHALAEIWKPATARQVARIARYDTSTTSSYLAQLVDRGLVEVVQERRRKKTYQLTERMYNIYYLMRRRGGAAKRVKQFVELMLAALDLEETAHLVVAEAANLAPEMRLGHRTAFSELLERAPNPYIRAKILAEIPEELAEWRAEAERSISNDLSSLNTQFLSVMADIEGYYVRLHGPSTLEWFFKAKDLLPEAEKAAGNDPVAWSLIARIWSSYFGEGGKSEIAYEKALSLKPDQAGLWAELGKVRYEGLGKLAEAESAYKRALELNKNDAEVWAKLGDVLRRLGRHDEAEQGYRQSLRLATDPWVCIQLAELYSDEMSRIEDAERTLRYLVKAKPRYAHGWVLLARLLRDRRQDYEEAARVLRRAIEFLPRNSYLLSLLGDLLFYKMHLLEEAEEVYRRALDGEGYEWGALIGLVRMLLQKGGRAEEAFQLATRAFNKREWASPEDEYYEACAKMYVANELYEDDQLAYLDQMEVWALDGLKDRPRDPDFLATAACVLAANGKVSKSLELAGKYLELVNPDERFIRNSLQLFTEIAAAGGAHESLILLEESPKAEALETLMVALQLCLAREVTAPIEMRELADELVARIEKRRAEIEATDGGDETPPEG